MVRTRPVAQTPAGTLRSLLILSVLTTGVTLIASSAFGDFREPREITEPTDDTSAASEEALSPHIACDGGDQLAIVFERGDELVYASSARRFENFDLTFGAEAASGPLRTASGHDGEFLTIYIEGGECRLKNDPSFLVLSSTLSTDGIDCFHVDSDGAKGEPGEVSLVWQEGEGDDAEVYLRNSTVDAELVASGDIPAVHVSEADNYTHIVYRDGDDLIYEQWAYGDAIAVFDATIPTPDGAEHGIVLAAHETSSDYSIYVVYRDEDGVMHYSMMSDAGDGFDDEVEIGDTDCDPDLVVKSDGRLVLCYALDGVVHVIDDFLGDDETDWELTDSDSDASDVSIAVDVRDQLHVCYLEGGGVFYTTDFDDADAPVADFEAEVTTGDVPLEVEFDELSSGVVWWAEWSFGNGDDSEDRGPVSTLYGEVGDYAVSLTVTGPGGEHTLTVEDYITTDEAAYTMRLPALVVAPGELDVAQIISGSIEENTSGYAVAIAFDESELEVTDLSTEGTDSGLLEPEFESSNIELEGEGSYAVLGVVYQSLPPFDGTVLEAGTNLSLATITYDVSEDAELDTELSLRLESGVSDPPINNSYSVNLGAGEETRLAYLYNPGVRTHRLVEFIRSDSNLNGTLTLMDPLIGLSYAFGLSNEVACLDAADSNDDGQVNILDGLFTLTFMFRSGPVPPEPYPDPGTDETSDDLEDCTE